MNKKRSGLSRRERQIMDSIYRRETATAAEVRADLPNAPTMNAVRRMLSILEEKGELEHKVENQTYIFMPVVKKTEASRSALQHVKDTFFEGSTAQAMAALIDNFGNEMSAGDLDMLISLAEKAREQDR